MATGTLLVLQIHKSECRVIFTNFLNAHSLPQLHPHAVRREVIKRCLIQLHGIITLLYDI